MILASTGTDDIISWPEATIAISLLFALVLILGGATATFVELRKAKILNKMQDDLRQLVDRYERLAESTMDAQQRVAVDVSELRTRTTAIEQILRTVE